MTAPRRRREDAELLAQPLNGLAPPHAPESEGAIIASVFVLPSFLAPVREVVKPEDFYGESLRQIFEAMCRVTDAGRVPDIQAVVGALRDVDRLEQVGGMSQVLYLLSLAAAESSLDGCMDHARLVAERSRHRRAIVSCQLWLAKSYTQPTPDVAESIGGFAKELAEVGDSATAGGLVHVKGVLVNAWRKVISSAKGEGPPPKRIGLKAFDEALGGLFDSDLTIIAARPGMGKTSLAMQAAVEIAATHGPVAVFSLEMSKEQLSMRTACSHARVPFSLVRKGAALSKEQWENLTKSMGFISGLPLYFDDRPKPTIDQIRASLSATKRAVEAKGQKLQAVVIDYIQLIRINLKNGLNLSQGIGEVTGDLKAIAKELDLPMIALSQLSRELEKEKRAPRLSDLRDSGSIEQDADNVLFIDRSSDNAELILAKSRNDQPGSFAVGWDGPSTRFYDLQTSSYHQ